MDIDSVSNVMLCVTNEKGGIGYCCVTPTELMPIVVCVGGF